MSYSSKIILAIDTVIGDGSISLWQNGFEVDSRILETGAPQSETLLETLQKSIKSANIEVNELDCIAVSVGPGSYTGIRVGIASVLGIAASTKIQTIGVSTLRSIVMDSDPVNAICIAALSTGGNDLISQEFVRNDGVLADAGPPKIVSIEDLFSRRFDEIITDRKTYQKIAKDSLIISIASENTARLIMKFILGSDLKDLSCELTPIYSREFAAKISKS